jgi:alanyl-tRNA synthetase
VVEVEDAANAVLWEDVPISARIYPREALAGLDLRKGADMQRFSSARVVSIGEWDRIGCGGTHVTSSGQVGAIGVRRWETYGSIARIEFVCGARALADYRAKTSTVSAACASLSVRPDELRGQIERLLGQAADLREEVAGLRRALTDHEARDLLSHPVRRLDGRPVVRVRLDGRDPGDLRVLAQRVVQGGGVALLGGATGGKAHLVFACAPEPPLDLSQLLKSALPAIDGRGGGQRTLAQGGGAGVEGLDAALDQALSALPV